MAEIIPVNGQSGWRNDYHYAVYEHKLVTADGMTYPRSFIVIKNRYGVIIRFTRLHNFAGAYGAIVQPGIHQFITQHGKVRTFFGGNTIFLRRKLLFNIGTVL